MNSAGVPQFNIEPLSQTRSLSANEMQVKVGEQTQKRTVRALQKDLHRCEDDLNEGFVPATNVLWGRHLSCHFLFLSVYYTFNANAIYNSVFLLPSSTITYCESSKTMYKTLSAYLNLYILNHLTSVPLYLLG